MISINHFNTIIEIGGIMTVRRKKKIRLKWKNISILIGTLLLCILLGITIPKIIPKDNTTKPKKEEKKVEINDKEEKYNQLDHIETQIEYFNDAYLDRYIAYKKIHYNMPNDQVIKNVNMNLDQTPYEYTIPAKYLNTEKVLVNKYYYLEENYVPDNLETISRQYALSNMRMVHEAKEAFEELSSTAKKEKLNIIAMSTYRSYSYQVNLYKRYVKQDGEELADTYSGRPGHSEHQTGLAVDVYNKEENYTNFEKTKEFDWMQQHAHEYGFILRFPKDKESETGYRYESWHYRYVGVDIATYIHNNNITLEEYYATKIKDW